MCMYLYCAPQSVEEDISLVIRMYVTVRSEQVAREESLGGHPVLTLRSCAGLQGFLVPEYLPDAKQSL